ncbi:hypothetical protein Tco_0579667 [Tanacetum coccineum]
MYCVSLAEWGKKRKTVGLACSSGTKHSMGVRKTGEFRIGKGSWMKTGAPLLDTVWADWCSVHNFFVLLRDSLVEGSWIKFKRISLEGAVDLEDIPRRRTYATPPENHLSKHSLSYEQELSIDTPKPAMSKCGEVEERYHALDQYSMRSLVVSSLVVKRLESRETFYMVQPEGFVDPNHPRAPLRNDFDEEIAKGLDLRQESLDESVDHLARKRGFGGRKLAFILGIKILLEMEIYEAINAIGKSSRSQSTTQWAGLQNLNNIAASVAAMEDV